MQLRNCHIIITILAFSITAWGQPVAQFTASPLSGCSPLVVSFNNTSTGATTYNWNFGNGNTSTLANPSAVYVTPGTYTVTLTATGPGGNNTSSTTITVFSNPDANFSISNTSSCTGEQVCFTNLSLPGSAPIVSWSWDFGDGAISSSQHPCHTYSVPGVYTIVLVVVDANGCQHSRTITNAVNVGQNFTADFTHSNIAACQPSLTVNFTATVAPAGNYSYLWDFGNGLTSTLANPSATYLSNGVFSVSLRITSTTVCTKTITKNALVRIGKPKADFIPNRLSGCEPLSVAMINSSQPDSLPLQYFWHTSNGLSSTAKNPTFLFDLPGRYSVRLVVRNSTGCTDTLIRNNIIDVLRRPESDIRANKRFHCKFPATVIFNANTTDTSIISYNWDFGDGNSGSGSSVQHTFNREGYFSVKLTVTSINGCTRQYVFDDYIIVKLPRPFLSIINFDGCTPRTVFVRANDTGIVPINQWKYIFRDTVRIIDTNLNGVFLPIYEAGKFDLIVHGINNDSCIAELRSKIIGGYKLLPDFVMDTNIRCVNPGIIKFKNTTVYHDSIKNDLIWKWTFGDGSISFKENPEHRYTTPGKFFVKLEVLFNGCLSDTLKIFDTITILAPQATIKYDGLKCLGDTVRLRSAFDAGNNWVWYSKHDTAFSSNFYFIKHNTGFDTITLILEDTTTGCRDTATTTLYLPEKPILKVHGINQLLCKPYFFILIDSSEYFDNRVASLEWFINDTLRYTLDTSHGAKFKWPYTYSDILNNSGYYKVMLVVKNENGCTDTLIADSAIKAVKLNAALSLSTTQGCIPLNIVGSENYAAEYPITKVKWNWGDGTIDSNQSQLRIHTYQKAPLQQQMGYKLILHITDSAGCTDTTSRYIFPSKPPATFVTFTSKYCQYDSVFFRWQSGGVNGITPYQFRWLIDDTVVATKFAFFRRFYEERRTAVAKLIITDARSCVDSITQLIEIDNRKPLAAFGADPSTIDCPGPPIKFIDNSIRGATPITKWLWHFGDSSTSQLQQPSKIYLKPGTYTVSLRVTDSVGCTSQVSMPDIVKIKGPWAEYTIAPKSDFNYQYIQPRSYFPLLILTDSNNCRISIPVVDTITVHSNPVSQFDYNKSKLCFTDSILVTNLSTHDKPMRPGIWTLADSSFSSSKPSFYLRLYEPGTYQLTLRVSDTLGCFDEKTIPGAIQLFNDNIPPMSPIIRRATVIDNHTASVDWLKSSEPDALYYTLYYNYIGSDPFSTTRINNTDDTVFIQGNLFTLNNTYSYSVSTTDYCLNESSISNLHTTIELMATGKSFANELKWNAYDGWGITPAAYVVYKHNPITDDFERYALVPGHMNSFIDSAALCNVISFYKIKAVKDVSESVYSWSDTSGTMPVYINQIPKPEHIRVTVVDNSKVLLQWIRKQGNYRLNTLIYRAVNENQIEFITRLTENDTAYIDDDVNVNEHIYTYYTMHQDACGGLSAYSEPSRTILLKADLAHNDALLYNPIINWNPYERWSLGVNQYNILHGNHQNQLQQILYKSAPTVIQFEHRIPFAEERDYCYKIIAYPIDSSNLFSESNTACVSTAPRLFAPNAFTVNNDGLNETFKLGGIFLESFHIEIYNRWGERVFESNDLKQGWDGTHHHKPCATDVYFYIASGKGFHGQRIELKGTVTLLR
jgi:gliding motility-associated-like protein